jgi:L,D-transpeptidase ErfK/SrfK
MTAPVRVPSARQATLALALAALALAGAKERPAPEPIAWVGEVVGAPSTEVIHDGDTLLDAAYRSRTAYDAVVRLNPGIDVWIPDPGTRVHLPTEMVLPAARHDGILINLPEMRLYDFTVRDGLEVLAIAIGDPDDPSPVGEFYVGEKREHPTWAVPASIRNEKPDLPALVPPGPENPLGDRWMTLSRSSYGIHGTNNKWSIGRLATHGCIRLYNSDMHRLYDRVAPRTKIRIIYEPVKIGRRGEEIVVEAHRDVYKRVPDPVASALVKLLLAGLLDQVDRDEVARAVREARGVPVRVGRVAPAAAATSGPSY